MSHREQKEIDIGGYNLTPEEWCDGQGQGTSWCNIAGALEKQPLSCVIDFLADQSRCNQSLDKEALARAWATYKVKSDWTPLPVRKVIDIVNDNVQKTGGMLILFTYLPLFIVAFFFIWAMVGLKLFRWGIGIGMTLLLVFLLYIMIVVFRSSLQVWLARKVDQILAGVKKSEAAALNHILKSPQAIMAAICSYTGCPWNCPPGSGSGSSSTGGSCPV